MKTKLQKVNLLSNLNKRIFTFKNIYNFSTKQTNTSNIFDYENENANTTHLKTYISEYKYFGKVDNDYIILDSSIKEKINKAKGDYIDIYKANKKYSKLIFLKIIALLAGLSFGYFLVLRKELVSSMLIKIPFLIISGGFVYLSLKARKLNITSFISNLSLSKDLKTVRIETFPSKVSTFNISELFLGNLTSTSGSSKEFVICYIRGKEYLLPLEFTSGYNESLLPLVIRGYKLK
jgi:hypothetical protein